MAQLPQALNYFRVHRFLHVHRPVDRLAMLWESCADTYPGRIECLLGIQFSDNLAEEDLHVALRLHEAAHDAKRRMKRSVFDVGGHGGDDGVVRSLARLQLVGVLGVERETCASVLKGETAALGDDAGAETAVVGVDEGGGVSVRIRDGEIDRVTALEGWRGVVWLAVLNEIQGAGGIEERGSLEEVLFRKEAFDGDGRDVGVGNVPVAVGKGQAEGLDDGVEVRRGVKVLGLERGDLALLLKLLDDAQGHQGDDSLAVGRVLPQFDALIGSLAGEALAAELERNGVHGLASLLEVVF